MTVFEGRVLKLDTVDACGRTFSADCNINFPETVPVTFNFNREVIGYADLSRDKDGVTCKLSSFYNDVMSENEYFVGGYYTQIKMHTEGDIVVIDSANMVSMGIIPEYNVADKNLKIYRKEN